MDSLDELIDPASAAALLALASAAAGGGSIGLLDATGALIAGRSPGAVPARVSPLTLGNRVVGSVVGDAGATPELISLVARAFELLLASERGQADRQRVSSELAIGRRIQLALLPHRFPSVPGWSFAADYEAAREVGGDMFDVFPLRGRTERIALLVADVTGKGIPAALLMADVRALLHAAADNADGPADALGRVNRILVTERATSQFVTAALLVVDTATGVVRHASAGHELPLVVRGTGGIDALDNSGPLLGAFADARFDEREARLEPGDALVLYTDGVTETRDETRRFYGEDRLLGVLAGVCGVAASEIVGTVIRDVRAFRGDAEPFDDLTLLVARHEAG
jgi:phosphoserine phosphatase RsbU/P